MVQAFVIALREGIEAALIVCLLLAAAEALGRRDLRRSILAGVGLAIVASFVLAFFLRSEVLNEELFEGSLMLAAAVMVATTMVWMWRASRTLKGRIEENVGALAGRGRGAALGLFALSFLMVVREGAEAALFLTASTLSTGSVGAAVGGGLGLLLALAFGVAFARGSLHVDLRRFFAVTSLILSVLVLQLLIGGIHELGEGKLIPVSRREMAIVGPIVRNNVLFVLAIALTPLFLALVPPSRRRSEPAREQSGAEARKLRAQLLRESRLRWVTASLSLVIVLVVGASYVQGWNEKQMSPGTPVSAVAGVVEIPLVTLADTTFHRFRFAADGGTTVRFIVVRYAGGWKVALDACEICGAAGYDADADGVICRLCDSPINAATIGRRGGCNPIPLPFVQVPGALRIKVEDLRAGAATFKAQHS